VSGEHGNSEENRKDGKGNSGDKGGIGRDKTKFSESRGEYKMDREDDKVGIWNSGVYRRINYYNIVKGGDVWKW